MATIAQLTEVKRRATIAVSALNAQQSNTTLNGAPGLTEAIVNLNLALDAVAEFFPAAGVGSIYRLTGGNSYPLRKSSAAVYPGDPIVEVYGTQAAPYFSTMGTAYVLLSALTTPVTNIQIAGVTNPAYKNIVPTIVGNVITNLNVVA